jgi:uncharacterized DUF497 family protein
MKLKFEWDTAKATLNIKKHGISFEMATLAFTDPFALTEQDRIENGELRWQTLGTAEGFLLLLVAHAIQDEEENNAEIIRIISARPATPEERRRYEQIQNHSL